MLKLSSPAKQALVISAVFALGIVAYGFVAKAQNAREVEAALPIRERTPWMRVRAKAQELANDKKFVAAEKLADFAIKMAIDSTGPDNADIADCMWAKEICLVRQGKLTACESVARLSLAMRERLKERDWSWDNDITILGLLEGMQGHYATAESIFWRADALRDSVTGVPMSVHPFFLDRIGVLRLAQQDYPGAESLLRQTLAGFKAEGDSVPPLEVRNVLDSLAALYDRTGRPANADSMRQQLPRVRR
jgi:hypothetical protein